MCRLADEVEQRTDVRKSGMEGFYANLLTKNVAMGGDVDAHAVSVYTAGSSRQSHVLSEQPAPEAKKSLKFNHSSAAADSKDNTNTEDGSASLGALDNAESSRYEDSGLSRRTASTEVVADGRKESVVAPTSLTLDSGATSHSTPIPSVATSIAPAPAAAEGKQEQILSAKDRYLARKRALES